ncbi:uncharacterized protein LOC136065922, partial [Quercus suber]|uniref:uncharacterized protein LOC136065922 n=1 Tax=Quercus suber TaxID=58331 RepID=UPI0032DF51F3
MGGGPLRRNQNFYCTYHRDKGHTTEQCRILKDHLEQLVKLGHLKEFVLEPRSGETRQTTRLRGNTFPPSLGVIEVIYAASLGTLVTRQRGVLTMVLAESNREDQPLGKRMKPTWELIAFNDDDLEGTTQPHDDALMVTTRTNCFIVKRVLVDRGSEAEVMYRDLFKGLGLKIEDLSKYDMSLVGFDGRIVVPKGHISILVNMEGKE